MKITIMNQTYAVKKISSEEINEITKIDGYTFGAFNASKRTILIEDSQTPICAYETLGHEIMHLMLFHSGLHNILTAEQIEMFCDALANVICNLVPKKQFMDWFNK